MLTDSANGQLAVPTWLQKDTNFGQFGPFGKNTPNVKATYPSTKRDNCSPRKASTDLSVRVAAEKRHRPLVPDTGKSSTGLNSSDYNFRSQSR